MSMATTQTQTKVEDGEIIDAEYDATSNTALAQLNSSEIDMQIATANKYPRSISTFTKQITTFATLDEETAKTMFYKLPRGKDANGKVKYIDGPSVRLAEVAASSYKNLRFGSRILRIEDRFIVAQGFCYDLENNIACACEVRRRITDSNGRRFGDDMIQVTGMAASSIALRNAIFKIIPLAYILPALNQAKLCAIGEHTPIAERREKAMTYWRKAGANDAELFAALGIGGVEDIGNEELEAMLGMVTAIKAGELTFEEALKPLAERSEQATSKIKQSSVNDKLKGKAEDKKPEGEKPTDGDKQTTEPAKTEGKAK